MTKNTLKQEAQQKYDNYLELLRQSGVTNMFGAAPYLQQEFGLSRREARDALMHWMENNAER